MAVDQDFFQIFSILFTPGGFGCHRRETTRSSLRARRTPKTVVKYFDGILTCASYNLTYIFATAFRTYLTYTYNCVSSAGCRYKYDETYT